MNRILHVNQKNPEVGAINTAVDVIKCGGVIIYPTDTVYGLGADALNPDAVLKIFTIKGRPLDQPLPVAVSGLDLAGKLAFINETAHKLMGAFWPGALTLVLKKKSIVPSIVVGGSETVGLRMPDHAVPLMVIRGSGAPLVATSANKHGKSSPLEAEATMQQIGDEVDLVLDGGCTKGQSSTIIDD